VLKPAPGIRRNTSHELADHAVEVRGDRRAAHLVTLQSARLRRRGPAHDAGGGHADARDDPVAAGRRLPSKRTVLRDTRGEIDNVRHLHGRAGSGLGLSRPKKGVHRWHRLRVHAPELLLCRKVDARCAGAAKPVKDRCALQPAYGQAQVADGDRRDREVEGRCDQRPHRGAQVGPVDGDVAQRYGGAVLHRCQRAGQPHRGVAEIQGQRLKRHRCVKKEIQSERFRREFDGRRDARTGQVCRKAVDLRFARNARGTGPCAVLRGHGIRDHRHVLDGLGVTGRFAVERRSARDAGFGAHEIAHALLGGHPRPARLAPAGAVEHADADADPVAFANGELHKLPPRGAENRHGPLRNAIADNVAD